MSMRTKKVAFKRREVSPVLRRSLAICAAVCSVVLALSTFRGESSAPPEAIASSITVEEAVALGIQASSFQLPTGAYYSASAPVAGKEASNRIPIGTYRVQLPDGYDVTNPATIQHTSGSIDAKTGGVSGTNCSPLIQDGEVLYLGESYNIETFAENGELASTAYNYDEIVVPVGTLIYLEPILTDGTTPQAILPGLTCFIDGQLFEEFSADKLSYEFAYGPNLISQNPYELTGQGKTNKQFEFKSLPVGWHMGESVETKAYSIGSETSISYTVTLTNGAITVPYSFSYSWATGYPGGSAVSMNPDEDRHLRVMSAAGPYAAVFKQTKPFMVAKDGSAIERTEQELNDAVTLASEAIDQHDIVKLSMAMSTFTTAAETVKSIDKSWMPMEQVSALNVVADNFLSLVAQAETWMDEWSNASLAAESSEDESSEDQTTDATNAGNASGNASKSSASQTGTNKNSSGTGTKSSSSTTTQKVATDGAGITVNYNVPDEDGNWEIGKSVPMTFGDGTKAEQYMGELEDGAQFVGWYRKGTVSSLIQTGDDISKLFDGSEPEIDLYPAIEGIGDSMAVEIVEVAFKDGLTDEVIDTRRGVYTHTDGVELPAKIVPPEAPEHEGYEFEGWDQDTTEVTEDLEVTAMYSGSGEYGEFKETVAVSQPRRKLSFNNATNKPLAKTGDAVTIISGVLLVASALGLLLTCNAKMRN